MATNRIKGLTVEIGGDTTKLGKALESVNKRSSDLSAELRDINRQLKFDPGNADLLAQKQKVLSEVVETTAEKLEKLKQAEAQVQEQFKRGEVSEAQVRELQREIIATTSKLEHYQRGVRETADAMKDLGAETKKTAQESADANNTMTDLAGKGLKGVAGLAAAAAAALVGAAESSRDYRMEMGKLDTAFTDNGFSSEAATGAYKELVGVLGETDQAVETSNHLAKLTENEKELATWTGGILPGVFATFGDSLPIEGLTEAANETAKVGQVTGPLADALNWAGVSEDAFNESLEKCTTEQERQALIMETLNDLYGDASAKYKETNADVIAANQATDAWSASMANLGAEVEPLLTEVKTMGAELLTVLIPAVRGILDNLPTIGIAIAGITAAMAAFKIAAIAATAATQGMTLAQYAAAAAQAALNVVMNANPIGLIILGITALVVAFKLLWDNLDGFKEFWAKAWEGIKTAFFAVVNFVKENWQSMLLFLVNPLAGIFKYCYEHFEGFRKFVDKTLTSVGNYFKALPGKISSAISGAIDRVRKWGSDLASRAKTAATNTVTGAVNTLKALPGRIYSTIQGAVSRVAQWGSNMVSRAKTAMRNVVSNVTSTLKELPGKVLSIGGDLVTGLWNGVRNKLAWLKSKLSGFASSVLGSIKNFFGVHSPARSSGSLKTTDYIGEMLDEGLAVGLEDNMTSPVKAMQKVSRGVLSAAQDADGFTLEQGLRRTGAATAAATGVPGGLLEKLDLIHEAIKRGQVIALDGTKLVGATVNAYDNKLGQRRSLAARGAV